MAGTAVTPTPATGMSVADGAALKSTLSASDWNSFRMSAVMDRLLCHVYGNRKSETVEFLNLCLSLARSIDFAIGNNEVPSRSQELPSLVKKVCQFKTDSLLQASIMVLMISLKSACQTGWFSVADSDELSNLVKEIGNNFCSMSNCSNQPNHHLSVISTIMSRFYPRIKLGHILALLEVKPGYDAYVKDFQISKNIKTSHQDKIRLLVVQTDETETSACLVSPAKANFLLNGRGVERRTNHSLDTGPQIPTIVNNLLKYGTNLLQAVGEFNGNYCIVIAFMSEVPNPHKNTLQDYEQHSPPATVDADSEIIVGPSRISLNCPISFKKIKTPVKGYSCKHIQCFDFENYMDINSRRPSWRCPHCNQHVSFSDIRIDRKMLKILNEAGSHTSYVLISSDGSWSAAAETDEAMRKPDDTDPNPGWTKSPPGPTDALDLTEIDDVMSDVTPSEAEDTKNLLIAAQKPTAGIGQSRAKEDFWSAVFLSTFGEGLSNPRPSTQVGGLTVLASVSEGGLDAMSRLSPNGMPSPNTSNEFERFPMLSRNVTQAPVGVQGLPVRTPSSQTTRSYANSGNIMNPNSLPAVSQASPNYTTASLANIHQGLPVSSSPLMHPNSRPAVSQASPNYTTVSLTSTRQGLPVSSSPLMQHSALQRNNSFPSAQPPQTSTTFQAATPNAYRVPNEQREIPIHSQTVTAVRTPQTSQSHRPIQHQPSPHPSFLRPPITTQQSQLLAAANRAVQMFFEPRRPVPTSYSPVTSPMDQRVYQPFTVADGHIPAAEMNWRPTARMRGALSGQAYAEAYNQAMSRPVQPTVQGVRPIPNVNSLPVQPQGSTAGGGFVQGVPAGKVQGVVAHNYALSGGGSSGRPVGSDAPDGSSGMN